jgi:hypothetical protein
MLGIGPTELMVVQNSVTGAERDELPAPTRPTHRSRRRTSPRRCGVSSRSATRTGCGDRPRGRATLAPAGRWRPSSWRSASPSPPSAHGSCGFCPAGQDSPGGQRDSRWHPRPPVQNFKRLLDKVAACAEPRDTYLTEGYLLDDVSPHSLGSPESDSNRRPLPYHRKHFMNGTTRDDTKQHDPPADTPASAKSRVVACRPVLYLMYLFGT